MCVRGTIERNVLRNPDLVTIVLSCPAPEAPPKLIVDDSEGRPLRAMN